MSINTTAFVHDTTTIKIVKCTTGKDGSTRDGFDIVITDNNLEQLKIYCFGDNVKVEIA